MKDTSSQVFIRMMEYAGNDVRSFKVHPTYEQALAEAKECAHKAGGITEISEHRDSGDCYEASVFCTAGVAFVIRSRSVGI